MTVHHSAPTGLSAAILAGGASRRMGADKALLRLAGQTLLERAINAVCEVADDVRIVGDRAAYHGFGVPVVPDLYPGTGPLGGIATALRQARHEHVLVVACDMPFLTVALLEAMARVQRGYDALVPVTRLSRSSQRQGGEGVHQTLHSIYAKSCLARIERRLASGSLNAFEMFAEMDVQELPEAWLRLYDPELQSFANVNDPTAWSVVLSRLEDNVSTLEDRE